MENSIIKKLPEALSHPSNAEKDILKLYTPEQAEFIKKLRKQIYEKLGRYDSHWDDWF